MDREISTQELAQALELYAMAFSYDKIARVLNIPKDILKMQMDAFISKTKLNNAKNLRLFKLSTTERAIYRLLCKENMRMKDIAETLHIAYSTARTHINNILRKTGASDQRDLMWSYYNEHPNF